MNATLSVDRSHWWSGWQARARALRNVPLLLRLAMDAGPSIVASALACRIVHARSRHLWVLRRDPAPVRCWMAHHQGMSLVAMAELLAGRRLQRDFHAEPLVRATERVLDERVPISVVAAATVTPRVLWPEESAA